MEDYHGTYEPTEEDFKALEDANKADKIIGLSEWDSASTEQRAFWLMDGYLLSPSDGEALRDRMRQKKSVKITQNF